MMVLFPFILAFGSKSKNEVVSYVTSFFMFALVQVYFGMNTLYLIFRIFKADQALDGTYGGNLSYMYRLLLVN